MRRISNKEITNYWSERPNQLQSMFDENNKTFIFNHYGFFIFYSAIFLIHAVLLKFNYLNFALYIPFLTTYIMQILITKFNLSGIPISAFASAIIIPSPFLIHLSFTSSTEGGSIPSHASATVVAIGACFFPLYKSLFLSLFAGFIHLAAVCLSYYIFFGDYFSSLIELLKAPINGYVIGTLMHVLVYRFLLRTFYFESQLAEERDKSVKQSIHAYRQLGKVFYPHQLAQIENGRDLEETMPTTQGDGCVISFDIIGSSKIQHVESKKFYRSVFRRCNEIMAEGYDGKSLVSNAYRIKEMGDGFLCSVGFPFKSTHESFVKGAIEVAEQFVEAFQDEVSKLDYSEPIHCGIGLAADSISGFYPESGTKEYDLFGRAIILATRYEAMRKVILKDSPLPCEVSSAIIILQEKVHMSLDSESRSQYLEYDLSKNGVVVRDDPTAKKLFYKTINASSVKSNNIIRLKF